MLSRQQDVGRRFRLPDRRRRRRGAASEVVCEVPCPCRHRKTVAPSLYSVISGTSSQRVCWSAPIEPLRDRHRFDCSLFMNQKATLDVASRVFDAFISYSILRLYATAYTQTCTIVVIVAEIVDKHCFCLRNEIPVQCAM